MKIYEVEVTNGEPLLIVADSISEAFDIAYGKGYEVTGGGEYVENIEKTDSNANLVIRATTENRTRLFMEDDILLTELLGLFSRD